MEIERKFLVATLPDLPNSLKRKSIEQGYISTSPVIRIRRSNNEFILTCKGEGLIEREEFELNITEEAYKHLENKLDNPLIIKTRYLIPYGDLTIELDIFEGHLKGLVIAEVEFCSMEAANSFVPPSWFGKDVSLESKYQNNHLSQLQHLDDL